MRLDEDRAAVDDTSIFPMSGVFSFGRGLFARDPIAAGDTSYKHLNRLHANQFVMSRLKAWEGAVALVTEEHDGRFLSPEFPTYSLDHAKVRPDYFALICQWGSFWQLLAQTSKGMGGRRERVHKERILDLAIDIPSLAEQRGIVDLIGSIDAYIDALETQFQTTRTARSALLSELLSNPGDDWRETTLGEVAMIRKGISYRSPELAEEGDGMPFLNLKSVARGGGYRSDGLKWFRGDYKPSQVVVPGDIVVCCTDLTKEKAILGYPVRVPFNTGHDSFCISLDLAALEVDETVALSGFIFLLLQGKSMREFMKANSSGTTVMHLRMRAVPDAPVVLPSLDQQRRIVDLVGSFDEQISSLESQVESARVLRSGVLAELLSGERLLDDSYDMAVGL